MKTKFNNMKKRFITSFLVVASFFGMNAIVGEEIVTTSYANTALDSWVNIKFEGSNDNVTVSGTTNGDASSVLNSFITLIKWLCLGGSIALLGMFILNIIKMGTAGTNVQARASAQQGLIWSGASAALLTISTTLFFFIQKSLQVQ